jgi:60 kDa SS-A/Ro ribonucleoprotein
MANRWLFKGLKSRTPAATAVNEAGGPAYALPPKHALAQLAATGCLNGTYYADAAGQLDALSALIDTVGDDEYLAKLAVYARRRGLMKDMPAALLCALSVRDRELTKAVFDRVVDNGRMLRTLFQMARSGRLGRKGLSSSLRNLFRRWVNAAGVEALLSASIGRDPSLRDVLRMARPKPADDARRALYGWLVGRQAGRWAPATAEHLPEAVRLLEAYRTAQTPGEQVALVKRMNVRWDLLADAAKGREVWVAIVKAMGPQALRMNLNTLARHGVFSEPAAVELVARRLSDPEEVRRGRQFPYQYFAAYKHVGSDVPQSVKAALHVAAEHACGNVPVLPGPVVIGVDVSGSMGSPVTGYRGRGSTTALRCVDAAALFAAAVLRRNPESVVVPFDTQAYRVSIDPSDSILSLAERLSRYGGGGTDCSRPLAYANGELRDRRFAGCVLVSDCESWVYKNRPYVFGSGGATGVMTEWQAFVKNQLRLGGEAAHAKLVCIDLQPHTTVQAPDRPDVLNVGGFSDAVFDVVAAFLSGDSGRFVAEVEAVEL